MLMLLALALGAAEPELLPVFLGKLAPGWQLSSWNETTFTQDGGRLAVDLGQPWAGFALDHRTEQWASSPIDATTLVFELQAEPSALKAITLYLDNGSKRFPIKATGVNRFEIDAINTAKADFSRVVFFNASKKPHVKFTLTAVRLERQPPPPAQAHTVEVTVDVHHPIPVSPYIYGDNSTNPSMRFWRAGGNRWSTYNYRNNASNAGIDYGPHSNDGRLSDSPKEMEAVDRFLRAGRTQKLVTIPMLDWVAADKNGNATQREGRFVANSADEQAKVVQFVHTQAPGTFFSLDNEPGLWPSTHPLPHPTPTTYAEMATRTRNYTQMIKRNAPGALVFFGVCYGWNEMVNLQNAPDAQGRDYIDFLLGLHMGDVLDVHWYPEIKQAGHKIVDSQTGQQSDARVQAPRALWDASFKEDSWIKGPVRLIPYLQEKIAKHAPAVRLAVTEYNYGGGEHISGAIAQADVLGIFGREGVFAAALWAHGFQDGDDYVHAAFKMFAHMSDTQLSVSGVPAELASVYAFTNGVVLINKSKGPVTFTSAWVVNGKRYVLDAKSKQPYNAGSVNGPLAETVGPLSITSLVFLPAPPLR